MPVNRFQRFLQKGALCAWLAALASAQVVTASPAPPPDALYQRTTNQFAEACFYKPAEPPAPDLTFSLAPMLLQQVAATNTTPPQAQQFGALTRSNGVLAVDTTRPTVYVATGTLRRNQKTYAQLTYCWVYPDFRLQGVRLTLNAAGEPCLWEVLTDSSGAELFFVSRTLEQAAQAEFGPPLPGRRYAIERSPHESPKAVVARVLEDGPMAMGPMVYLEAGTRDVSTLICRCMPAQAKHLLRTSTFALVPVSGTAEELLNEARNLSGKPPAFWLGDALESTRLEQALRLPKSF